MTLFGKRVFADLINSKILRSALNPMTNALMKDTQRRDTKRRGEAHVKKEAETRVRSHKPRNANSQQKRQQLDSDFPKASGGSMTFPTP